MSVIRTAWMRAISSALFRGIKQGAGGGARIYACTLLFAMTTALLLFATSAASEPERLAVYAPQSKFVLPVSEIAGRKYVGIFELVEPLSAPELKATGIRWKLRVPDSGNRGKFIEAEFEDGSTLAQVHGQKITLFAPARHENGRLLLPLHGIGNILKPLLQTDVVFHEASRRLFLGKSMEEANAELRKGNPSTLALHFPVPVSPTIIQEGNVLRLSFSKEPVVISAESGPLNDELFSRQNYSEDNGGATLTITGSAPLLASFVDGGKTIVISGAPSPPAAAPAARAIPLPVPAEPGQAAIPTPPPGLAPPATETATTGSPRIVRNSPPPAPPFMVVIDPGHGGSDTGARITPTLAEKDITLSLARRLRWELQSRHIAVDLLRDTDSDLSFDQRAAKTNLERPAIFISLHAEPGTVMRIYTSALPISSSATIDKRSFPPWQAAQQAFSAESAALAPRIAQSIGKRAIRTQIRSAFLEPMGSIAAPAVAVEVPASARGLRIPEEQVAGAIADAIVVWKSGGSETR